MTAPTPPGPGGTNGDHSDDIADLQALVRGLRSDLGTLQQQVGQMAAAAASGPAAGNNDPGDSEDSPQPPARPHILTLTDEAFTDALTTLATWVDGYFVPTYVAGRPIKPTQPWCPQWWKHDEAIARLEALHYAFEALVTAPKAKRTGRATWLTDFVDPTLAQLRSPTGPFIRCTTDPDHPKHGEPEPLPVGRYSDVSEATDDS